jgi:hypothetical protein
MDERIIIAADWEPAGWRVFVYDPFGSLASPTFLPSGHTVSAPTTLSPCWNPTTEIPHVYEINGFVDRVAFLNPATFPNKPTELLIESAHLWERTPASLAQVFDYSELVALETIASTSGNLQVIEFPHSLAKRARLESGFMAGQKDMDPQAQALFRIRRSAMHMRELDTSYAIGPARSLTSAQLQVQARREYRSQIVQECNQRLNIMRRHDYGVTPAQSFFQEHIDALEDVQHMRRIIEATYSPGAAINTSYPSRNNMERFAGMKYWGPMSSLSGQIREVSMNTCMSVYVAVRYRQTPGGSIEIRKSPNGIDNIGLDTVWSKIFNMSSYHGGIGGVARANLMHYNLANKSRSSGIRSSVSPLPTSGGNPTTPAYLDRQAVRREFRATIKGLIRLFRDSTIP